MLSSYSVYYFMMGNIKSHKEIGTYIINNKDINNFDNIKFTCDDIFLHCSEDQSKNSKNKKEIDKYTIFYTLNNSGIFYLAVIIKNSLYSQNENLVYELFEDIENSGIKKLVDKNGELSLIGKQNLKFCIEQDQEENIRKNNNSTNTNSSYDDYFQDKKGKDASKLSLLNNEINDIQNNVKESMKNIISNVNEMQDLDEKSLKIKNISSQFKKESSILERKVRYRKILYRIMAISIILIILIIILYFIFK